MINKEEVLKKIGKELLIKCEELLADIVKKNNLLNKIHSTTVAEKIINHVLEDDIKIQDKTNRKIFRIFHEGIKNGKIPTKDDLLALNDEDISRKLADALIKRENPLAYVEGINFIKEEEDLEKSTDLLILSHKKVYIEKLVHDLKDDPKNIDHKKIITLYNLKNDINKEILSV